MTSRLRAYLDLVRPLNLLITFLSVCAASVIAGAGPDDSFAVLAAGLSAALIAAGANAVNDFYDVDIDRVNRPDRPIPRGDLSPKNAWHSWVVLTISGFGLSLLIGSGLCVAISIGAAVLLYVYSSTWKSTPLTGNIVVSIMTGMAFMYGATAVGEPLRGAMPALFAFLSNMAREVVKDIEDREGDAMHKAQTFPVRYGVRPAQLVASVALVLLILATFAAYFAGVYTTTYLAVVLAADGMLAFTAVMVLRQDAPASMHRLSGVLKASMVVGLAAMYFGSRP